MSERANATIYFLFPLVFLPSLGMFMSDVEAHAANCRMAKIITMIIRIQPFKPD